MIASRPRDSAVFTSAGFAAFERSSHWIFGIGCPARETSSRGGRPRAVRCGRPATQALAFGQGGAPTARETWFACGDRYRRCDAWPKKREALPYRSIVDLRWLSPCRRGRRAQPRDRYAGCCKRSWRKGIAALRSCGSDQILEGAQDRRERIEAYPKVSRRQLRKTWCGW